MDMYNNNFYEDSTDYFVKTSNKIEIILPQSEYTVNFKFDGVITKRFCFIIAEKIDHKEMIQLRISEKDHRKLYISTINMEFFNFLKSNQSLHVTFSGFIENLLKFFQDCQKGNLQMSILRTKENQLSLEFFEKHSFKNLTHLSLPIEEAPLYVVNFHLYRIVEKFQIQKQLFDKNMQNMKNDLNNSFDEITQLKKHNLKLKQDLSEQKQNFLKRRKEELEEMQENIKKLTDSKELDEMKYKKNIEQLQSRIDLISLEKANAVKEKGNETKKYENARKENVILKNNISNLKLRNEQLASEISSTQNQEQQNKIDIHNLNRKHNELNENLKKLHKIKSELEAELEAERQICQTKRNALAMATEEISKANQIISKQSLKLVKLQKTIDWRTEVALQQEFAIKDKENTISYQRKQILNLRQELESLRKETAEFPNQLKSIQDLTDSLEYKYSKKFSDIKKKIGN